MKGVLRPSCHNECEALLSGRQPHRSERPSSEEHNFRHKEERKNQSVFWFRSFTSITAYLSSHGHSNFLKALLIKNTFWKQFAFGHQAEVLAVKDKSGLNCHPRAVGEREGAM